MSEEKMASDAEWLEEAARYFEKRPTCGEDMAFWANVSNAERCRSIAQSLCSKPVAGVEVKPLEWHGPDVNDEIYARSALCVYTIQKQRKSMGFWLTEVGGNYASIDEAKAVAEADYRQRILSTLSLPAQEARVLPSKFRIDGDAAKAISFMLGSSDEDDDTWSDALLWVGNLEDDDGEQVFGLHLANSEYPEEGSITLATFAPQPEADITEEIDARLYHLHVEALAEIKAAVDGESDQSVKDIIYGLLAEIALLPTHKPLQEEG